MPKNKKRSASRGNILIKIKKMISENDENIDEFSQVPEFTPNKQLTLTLLNLEVVLLVAKISQKKFNMDKIKQMSRKY